MNSGRVLIMGVILILALCKIGFPAEVGEKCPTFLLKSMDGKEIQSVDDALKFYDNLKSSSSVELQIERQGESLSINYQIE